MRFRDEDSCFLDGLLRNRERGCVDVTRGIRWDTKEWYAKLSLCDTFGDKQVMLAG